MLFESTPIVHSGTSPYQLAIIIYQQLIVNFAAQFAAQLKVVAWLINEKRPLTGKEYTYI